MVNPTMIMYMTGGFASTEPSLRGDRGMRTDPTEGCATNQIVPIRARSPATSIAAGGPNWVAIIAASMGPSTQMISCREASRENTAGNCRAVASLG